MSKSKKIISPSIFLEEVAVIISTENKNKAKADTDMSDVMVSRAIAFTSALLRPLAYIQSEGEIKLTLARFSDYLELSKVEELILNQDELYRDRDDAKEVTSSLIAYIKTIPFYDDALAIQDQPEQMKEYFGAISMTVMTAVKKLEADYDYII